MLYQNLTHELYLTFVTVIIEIQSSVDPPKIVLTNIDGFTVYKGLVFVFAGFLCPVHTPDGAPCGLMNHATALCQVCRV